LSDGGEEGMVKLAVELLDNVGDGWEVGIASQSILVFFQKNKV
jgi:hypothetical protein